MSKFLNEYFDFRGHLSTFRAENTPKSRPFKGENSAQTLPKQLQNNFEKVQNTIVFKISRKNTPLPTPPSPLSLLLMKATVRKVVKIKNQLTKDKHQKIRPSPPGLR